MIPSTGNYRGAFPNSSGASARKTAGGNGGRCLQCFVPAAVLCLVSLFATPEVSLANKNAPSMPASIFAAKTIYIDNQTTSADLQNDAYMALAKWGHFQVVDNAQKADLVLRLTGSSYVQSVPRDTPPDMTMASAKTGTASNTASTAGTSFLPNGYEPAPDGFTRLTLLDTRSGNVTWSDLSRTNTPQAAMHILDALREAFEQGRKAREK